jgi:hypothetical protein
MELAQDMWYASLEMRSPSNQERVLLTNQDHYRALMDACLAIRVLINTYVIWTTM